MAKEGPFISLYQYREQLAKIGVPSNTAVSRLIEAQFKPFVKEIYSSNFRSSVPFVEPHSKLVQAQLDLQEQPNTSFSLPAVCAEFVRREVLVPAENRTQDFATKDPEAFAFWGDVHGGIANVIGRISAAEDRIVFGDQSSRATVARNYGKQENDRDLSSRLEAYIVWQASANEAARSLDKDETGISLVRTYADDVAKNRTRPWRTANYYHFMQPESVALGAKLAANVYIAAYKVAELKDMNMAA